MKRRAWFTLLAAAFAFSCRQKEGPGAAGPALTPPPVEVIVPERMIGAGIGLKEPRGIAVDAKGQIFVGDTANHRVVRLDSTGNLLASWGSETRESAPGKFGLLSDLAVTPDGQVVTLDAAFGDIQVFTAEGELVLRVAGVAPNASGVAVAPDGKIWVAVTGLSQVRRLAPDGKLEAVYEGAGDSSHLRFEQPTDVALAPDGTAYVVDLRGRIMRLAADGRVAAEWKVFVATPRGGSHLEVWEGQVVMSDPERNRLDVLDPASGSFRCVGAPGTDPGQFRLPIGLARGPGGRLYVLDSENARVQVFGSVGSSRKAS